MVHQFDAEELRPQVPTVQAENHLITEGLQLMPLPAFFYDFVVPMSAQTPSDLLAEMGRVIAITGKSFARRGMIVNDEPGTTEAMLTIHGNHSRQENRLVQTRAHIKVDDALFGQLKVNIVYSYKHLGSVNTGPFRLEREAQIRGGICKTTFKQLSKQAFKNKTIEEKCRIMLWKSLCLSKLLHHTSA